MITPGLFFLVAGALCILVARASEKNSRLIAEAMAGRTKFANGQRIAVIGTIESEMPPMLSPARNLPSLMYTYVVTHSVRGADKSPHDVTDFHGRGMVPSYVASGIRKIRLLEFPILEHFGSERVSDPGAAERVAARTATATFSMTPPLIRPGREELAAGRAWAFDGRITGSPFDPAMTISEEIVPPRRRVVAVGHYSEGENGLERIQLLNDEREVAFERTGRQTRLWRMIGIIAILIAIAFFVAEIVT